MRKLTLQQHELWARLTNNYEYFARTDSPRTFAHRMGLALQGKDLYTIEHTLNHVFPIIMRRHFVKLDRILMLRRWLMDYNLPIYPTHMIWFDRFHRSHGSHIKKYTDYLDTLDFTG